MSSVHTDAVPGCSDEDETQLQAFVSWAGAHHRPLPPVHSEYDLGALGEMVGDARVVALSEAVHGAAEPLEFRNRAIEYLVEKKGFTAVAIESGIVEGQRIHEYVRGGEGNLDEVLAEGLSWTFDQLPQNRVLIRWLRQFNARSSSRKVNFYGFDVPGSPGEIRARRGLGTALSEALRFLRQVDGPAGSAFDSRLGALTQHIHFDLCASEKAHTYEKLSPTQRDCLTAAISDLITLLERRAQTYSERASSHQYEWAYRAAIGARQADSWLREVPLGWRPTSPSARFPSPQMQFLAAATEVRDRAQADNLEWILAKEGPTGKIIVFGHRYHVSAAPVRATWSGIRPQAVMGLHLRRRFGRDLVTVGSLVTEGEINAEGFLQTLKKAGSERLDGIVDSLGPDHLLLDLRQAPPAVARWLERERSLSEVPLGDEQDSITVPVSQAFDLLHFIRNVTPACRGLN